MILNKELFIYIKNYINNLSQTVSLDTLKIEFVFQPERIKELYLRISYTKFVVNVSAYNGSLYGYIYFNMPKISEFIYSYYENNQLELINLFLQRLFYCNYRHYQQFKDIKELHNLVFLPDNIEMFLKADAENYASKIIKDNEYLSIRFIEETVRKNLKENYSFSYKDKNIHTYSIHQNL